MQVMMERDHAHPLRGWVEHYDTYYLGDERSAGKLGGRAPGKTPFVAAIETNDERRPLLMKLNRGGELPTHRNRRLAAAALHRRHPDHVRWLGMLQRRECGRVLR